MEEMKLTEIFEQVLKETQIQSLDDLFIQELNLCVKAEKLIVNAIINGCKPFQLSEADNSVINNIAIIPSCIINSSLSDILCK
jgi:hypothetical protein